MVFAHQNGFFFFHEGRNLVFSYCDIPPSRIVPCYTVGVCLMSTFVFLPLWIAQIFDSFFFQVFSVSLTGLKDGFTFWIHLPFAGDVVS